MSTPSEPTETPDTAYTPVKALGRRGHPIAPVPIEEIAMRAIRHSYAGSILLALLLAAAAAEAEIVSDMAPPPDKTEHAPAARDGYVWNQGHWEWTGHSYAWVAGTWIASRPKARWVADHWDEVGTQWHFVAGHWER